MKIAIEKSASGYPVVVFGDGERLRINQPGYEPDCYSISGVLQILGDLLPMYPDLIADDPQRRARARTDCETAEFG